MLLLVDTLNQEEKGERFGKDDYKTASNTRLYSIKNCFPSPLIEINIIVLEVEILEVEIDII